jgi:DNA-binding NarL/FixJ family response regulator
MRVEGRTAVILDQHPLWVDAVDQVLEPLALDVVAKTTSIAAALDAVATLRPELLLMDLDLDDPPRAGLECIRRARELAPGLDVVVLSGHGETEAVEAAFAAGAIAFVVKTAQPDDIVAAVRQVFDHSIFLRSAFSPTPRAMPPQTHGEQGLTRRELEILRLVSEGHSNAQVARTLWVTEQTVKFHLSNIYRKLDVGNRTEASRWAQLHGVLAPEGVDVQGAGV